MALRSHWKANKEEVVAEHGVVTAMQPLSAEAGLEMLKRGGNAIDAAVAMGFCNVVLEPYMAVIGGMGYMLIHLAQTGQTVGVDFNGRAPRRAHAEMFEVLGPCAGFCAIHKRFGILPLEQVLEPAMGLASDGFETNWHSTLYVANTFD